MADDTSALYNPPYTQYLAKNAPNAAGAVTGGDNTRRQRPLPKVKAKPKTQPKRPKAGAGGDDDEGAVTDGGDTQMSDDEHSSAPPSQGDP